ncbi:MAG TPA: HAMP domain-containing sensor histidine kinase [Flavobacterium sp.]
MSLKINSIFSSYWRAYAKTVKLNILGSTEINLQDITHWRSVIFVNIITWILPSSVFALVPSITMAFINGMPIVGFADIAVFILLYLLAMNRQLSLVQRKFLLISIAYVLALILLIYESWSGPGLLLLLANTIFASIIYSSSVAYLSVWANICICLIIWLLIYLRINIQIKENYNAATWVAISSNLIFLSFICAKFLLQLIKGMETSFNYGKSMHANLTATINSTDASIYSLDRSLRYISFNKTQMDVMKQNHGIDIKPGDYIRSQYGEPNEYTKFWSGVYQEVLAGATMQFERDYTIGTRAITAQFSLNPIIEGQQIIGLSCLATDVTAKKKMRVERAAITDDLIARNKNLEQFSYIVSHNLRAPATNILGFAELLQKETLTPSEITTVVNGISSAANKLDGVIKDLNEILKVRTSLIENKEVVDFQSLVDDISLSVGYAGNQEQLTIQTDFPEIDKMNTLRSYLYSIFDNLIKNSIKYKSQDRPLLIEINSRRTAGGIQLIFKDNGVGIDLSKNSERIFGLYNRFHVQVEGKGMGLFMVKTQVEVLGGRIKVLSTVDEGTEFIIDFQTANTEL